MSRNIWEALLPFTFPTAWVFTVVKLKSKKITIEYHRQEKSAEILGKILFPFSYWNSWVFNVMKSKMQKITILLELAFVPAKTF